jgi:DNA-binding transcriptional ArsR family regulator
VAKRRFTRLPKIHVLTEAGVPAEAIPTFYALADHANNRTGECWPSMRRLAEILGKSTRTIQRHLHALRECGLLEFVERRRYRGRFSSYLFRVVFFTSTTGHECPPERRASIYKGTKRIMNRKKPPRETQKERRKREAAERKQGYEWLFG